MSRDEARRFCFRIGPGAFQPRDEGRQHRHNSRADCFVLEQLKVVLEAAGTNLDRVLKVTVYVSDIAVWDEVDAADRTFCGNQKPTRSAVPIRKLHHGFKVEIEAIVAVQSALRIPQNQP